MGLGIASRSFFLCVLLLLLIAQEGGARKIARDIQVNESSNVLQISEAHSHRLHRIINNHVRKDHDDEQKQREMKNQMDPELNIFFTPKDLKIGKKMPIYFSRKNPSKSPKFLPREESDRIPFSSTHLDFLLQIFSFAKHSSQAKAMNYTLTECEIPPMDGESKFCATSLESLLDHTHRILGPTSRFKVLSTTLHLGDSDSSVLVQNYTILQIKRVSVPRIVGCHPMPYPYAVFYCHSQEADTSLFEVAVEGDGGGRVEAVAVCHMDTSMWNRDHVAFAVLKVEPGTSPVCHFFPPDNLVFVPSSSDL